MRIRPVGAEIFHADGQTRTDRRTDGQLDRHEEFNSHFSQF